MSPGRPLIVAGPIRGNHIGRRLPGDQILPSQAARIVGAAILFVATLLVLRPFVIPMLWAAILAYLTWPLYLRLAARTRRRELSAAAFALLVALGLGIPVALVIVSVANDASNLASNALEWQRAGAPLPDWLTQHAIVQRALAFARENLASPERLYSPRVRDEAQQLLTALQSERAVGPRMEQARQRLAAALKRATTAITVRLTSDNATEVTLFRVGPLGRFQDREIALTPGTYTLMGLRPGYKDVRVELIVDPDSPAPRVIVACEERV